MAEVLNDTDVLGVTIPLTVEDKASPKIKELVRHFTDVAEAMKKSGKGENDILAFLNQLIVKLSAANPQIKDFEKSLTSAFRQSVNPIRNLFSGGNGTPGGNSLGGIVGIENILKIAGKAFISFKAAVMPGKTLRRFADECSNINFKLSTLAMTAGMSVDKLYQLGAAYKAYGGSASDAARGHRAYELAMEQRRRGQGEGGVYAEAWRRYGIQFNQNETYADYQRRVIQWMERQGAGRAAEARKLNLKQILGLSDAEFRMMNKGLGAWDAEQARNEKYKPTAEKAAKASESLTQATAHLTNAWQNVKDKVFVALEPILTGVYNVATQAIDGLGKLLNGPGADFVAWIGAAGAAVIGVVSAFRTIGHVKDFLSAINAFATVSKATKAAGAAGTITEKIGGAATSLTPTGMSGGGNKSSVLSKFGKYLSIGKDVAILVSLGIVAGESIAINKNLKDVYSLLISWMQVWMLYSSSNGAKSKKSFGKYRDLYEEALSGLNSGTGKEWSRFADLMGDAHRRNSIWNQQMVYGLYKADQDAGNSASVSVEKIDIVVNGDRLDPKGVAEAVHDKIIEEFRVLASQDNTRELR